MSISVLPIIATLTVSGALAAWPIVLSRPLRSALRGTCGILLVLAGAAGFFALTCGAALAEGGESAAAADAPAQATKATNSELESTSLNTLPLDLPLDVVIPPGRPSWVESEPKRDGSVHTTAVKSGPYKRDSDARQALDKELEEQTAAYIAETLGSKLAKQFIWYDASQIKAELVARDKDNGQYIYHETIESPSVGSMEQYHALIEFSPGFQDRIRSQWDEVKAKSRLAQLGLIAGAAILLLGTVFSYFRVDTATRGYYTGRLQFLSAAAILAIVGAGVFLARWIHWL